MKRLLVGGLMAVLLAVGAPVLAGPIVTDINLAVSQNVGSVTDSLSGADLYGGFTIGPITTESGLFLSIYMVDSVASAAVTDTLVFNLVRRPYMGSELDTAQSALVTDLPNGWISVYATPLTGVNAGNFPLTKHIPLDSLAVYPMTPGYYRWAVYGGRTTAAHYISKAFKFKAYIETEEKW